jgi:hypothetical protein
MIAIAQTALILGGLLSRDASGIFLVWIAIFSLCVWLRGRPVLLVLWAALVMVSIPFTVFFWMWMQHIGFDRTFR